MPSPPTRSFRTAVHDPAHLGSARELLAADRRSDLAVRRLLERVHERFIHDEWSERPRTVAEQLGHLGEFPLHVARQLEEWLDGDRIILGRGDLDADLENGIALAARSRLAPLLAGVDSASAVLSRTLARLADEHLRATVHHVVRGREPLATFLVRCVIDHRRAHAVELAGTLDALPAERTDPTAARAALP